MSHPTDLPLLTRRRFWQASAVTITGGTLLPFAPVRAAATGKAQPRGAADCVIFLNLVGGPSQMDTYDVKEYGFTPPDLKIGPHKIGVKWSYGLLPRTAEVLEDVVIARSMA